ncbi:death domain-containing protein [Caerostris darwini]|uniref:Death domain-containing protein n=1 Tax=Caerostris darwini TaxID=1538125 RepID=A0AAV4PUW1_9ARAC|nr:death domain-containing protein [Caerostris darwini]
MEWIFMEIWSVNFEKENKEPKKHKSKKTMDCTQPYCILIEKIIQAAGNNFSLEQVKEHFAGLINSKRALSKANSLNCVLRLLEERDKLHSKNVTCLQALAEILNIEKIKTLVYYYEKIYFDYLEEDCRVCGESTNYQQEILPLTPQVNRQSTVMSNNNIIQVSDLTEALRNISVQIGKEWPLLARELGIAEGHIEQIRRNYSSEGGEAALRALHLWLTKEQENASIEVLDKALNSKHCKRKGIGSHMRQRIITI